MACTALTHCSLLDPGRRRERPPPADYAFGGLGGLDVSSSHTDTQTPFKSVQVRASPWLQAARELELSAGGGVEGCGDQSEGGKSAAGASKSKDRLLTVCRLRFHICCHFHGLRLGSS